MGEWLLAPERHSYAPEFLTERKTVSLRAALKTDQKIVI